MATPRTAQRKSSRPTRAEQAAARREELLSVAVRHFAAKGFEATNLEDVAGDAGVTKGLLYHYFGSKRDLFLACVESLSFETTLDAFPAIVNGAPVGDVVSLVTAEAAKVIRSHEDEVRILIQSTLAGDADAQRRITTLLTTFEQRLGAALGDAPDIDPDADCAVAAANLVSALIAQVLLRTELRVAGDLDAALRELVRVTSRGLVR